MKQQRAAIFQMMNAKGKLWGPYSMIKILTFFLLSVVGGYEEIQERGSLKLLSDIIDQPTKAYISVKWFTAETLVTLVYGKKFKPDGVELKALLGILETFVQDIHPARYLVDTFPVLDYLPTFLATWRKDAQRKYATESQVSSFNADSIYFC